VDNLRRVAAEQIAAPLAPSNDDGDWLRTVVVMGAVEAAANPRHLPGVDSAHDLRRIYVIEKRRAGQQDTFAALLALDMACVDRDGWNFRMAHCAYVAQVLAADGAGWAKKLLGKQKEIRGRAHAYDRRKVAVESVLGDDPAKNEARWQKQCKAMQPVWEVDRGVFAIGPRSMLVGIPGLSAAVSAVEPPPKGDYVFSGRCELGPGNAEHNFRIETGWDGKTLVGVTFDDTAVSIAVWQREAGKWADKDVNKVGVAGRPFDFRVEVTATEVRAFVDGMPRCSWKHGGRELHSVWSLGADDRVVWLEGLKIEPLVLAKK